MSVYYLSYFSLLQVHDLVHTFHSHNLTATVSSTDQWSQLTYNTCIYSVYYRLLAVKKVPTNST